MQVIWERGIDPQVCIVVTSQQSSTVLDTSPSTLLALLPGLPQTGTGPVPRLSSPRDCAPHWRALHVAHASLRRHQCHVLGGRWPVCKDLSLCATLWSCLLLPSILCPGPVHIGRMSTVFLALLLLAMSGPRVWSWVGTGLGSS